MSLIEILQTALSSPTGSFAFIVAIIGGMIWVAVTITKFKTKWDLKEKGLEKLEQNVDGIRSDIMFIKAQINLFASNKPDSLTQSHSPINLTEIGKKVAGEMGIENLIAANWDKIYDFVDKNVKSKNAYDIQQFCIEAATIYLDKLFSVEDLNKIKTFAYNSGRPLGFYGGMIGVLIRNKYFELKRINPDEVDKYKPI